VIDDEVLVGARHQRRAARQEVERVELELARCRRATRS
jgi:hypothetical protein